MPFIPLDDDVPRLRIGAPWITWGLIAACLVMYWTQSVSGQQGGLNLIYALGVIPATLSGAAELDPALYMVDPWATLVTYQFLHGSLMHLAGNLLYLWVFGDNVEDAMGHGRFLLFYLICGILAGLAQVLVAPTSEYPMIGASGAISGVLGAYLVLHPRARVLVPILYIPVYLPAWLLLVVWIGFQVLSFSNDPNLGQGGTAWLAHIAGFAVGALFLFFFRRPGVPLFGSRDLPSGVSMRDKARWGKSKHRRKPWGE